MATFWTSEGFTRSHLTQHTFEVLKNVTFCETMLKVNMLDSPNEALIDRCNQNIHEHSRHISIATLCSLALCSAIQIFSLLHPTVLFCIALHCDIEY